MQKTELCRLLKSTTYLINVYQSGELVSQGSGVSINKNGDLLTAAHVISGRLPVREKDIQNLTIQARVEGKSFNNYSNPACGLSFSLPHLKESVTIDLAILKNLDRSVNNRPFLKINQAPPDEGTDILMGGFSDEVYMPFAIEENLNFGHPDLKGHEDKVQFAMKNWMRISMFKSGMVGKKYDLNLSESSTNFNFKGHSIYIDNVMHSGASGGPVINYDGELVGIITKRAITTISNEDRSKLQIPSGSAIAISPNTIIDYYNNIGGELDFTPAN